jgi:predicted component of type VI protein secretion system
MPEIKVIKKGITSAVRAVPTDTTLTILPMTLDRVGRELADEDEVALRVDSPQDAFEKFKPSIHFETRAGEEETEFVADLEFHSIKDFSPENIQKRVPGKRNDLADMGATIGLLYRLKDRWTLPAVKRAWADPNQRRQILDALARLRTELEKVAQAGKVGE